MVFAEDGRASEREGNDTHWADRFLDNRHVGSSLLIPIIRVNECTKPEIKGRLYKTRPGGTE